MYKYGVKIINKYNWMLLYKLRIILYMLMDVNCRVFVVKGFNVNV